MSGQPSPITNNQPSGFISVSPGSAESVFLHLDGRGLACSHFPKYHDSITASGRQYPSRLGFFHTSVAQGNISYLDTANLCAGCLDDVVPSGYVQWISSTGLNSSIELAACSTKTPPLIYQAGTELFDHLSFRPTPVPSNLTTEPVSLAVLECPGFRDAWAWIQRQGKPFYTDRLHLTHGWTPFAQAGAQADAAVVASHGQTYVSPVPRPRKISTTPKSRSSRVSTTGTRTPSTPEMEHHIQHAPGPQTPSEHPDILKRPASSFSIRRKAVAMQPLGGLESINRPGTLSHHSDVGQAHQSAQPPRATRTTSLYMETPAAADRHPTRNSIAAGFPLAAADGGRRTPQGLPVRRSHSTPLSGQVAANEPWSDDNNAPGMMENHGSRRATLQSLPEQHDHMQFPFRAGAVPQAPSPASNSTSMLPSTGRRLSTAPSRLSLATTISPGYDDSSVVSAGTIQPQQYGPVIQPRKAMVSGKPRSKPSNYASAWYRHDLVPFDDLDLAQSHDRQSVGRSKVHPKTDAKTQPEAKVKNQRRQPHDMEHSHESKSKSQSGELPRGTSRLSVHPPASQSPTVYSAATHHPLGQAPAAHNLENLKGKAIANMARSAVAYSEQGMTRASSDDHLQAAPVFSDSGQTAMTGLPTRARAVNTHAPKASRTKSAPVPDTITAVTATTESREKHASMRKQPGTAPTTETAATAKPKFYRKPVATPAEDSSTTIINTPPPAPKRVKTAPASVKTAPSPVNTTPNSAKLASVSFESQGLQVAQAQQLEEPRMKPRKNVSTGASSSRVAPEAYIMPAQLPQTQKAVPSVLQTPGLEITKKKTGSTRAVIGAALGAVAGAAVAGLSGIPPVKLSLAPSLQANVNVHSIRGEKPNKSVQKEAREKPTRQTERREKPLRAPSEGRNLADSKANMKIPLPRIKKEKIGQPQVHPKPLNHQQPGPRTRAGGMKDKAGTRAGPAISRPRAQATRFKQQKVPVKQRPVARQTGVSNVKKQPSAGPSSNKTPPSRKPVPGSKSSGMSSMKRTGMDTTTTSHQTRHVEYSMFSSKTYMSQVDHEQSQSGFESNSNHGYPGYPNGSGEQPAQSDPLSPWIDTDPGTSPLEGPTTTGNPLDQTENQISSPGADVSSAEDKVEESQAQPSNAFNSQVEKVESNSPGHQVEDQFPPSSNTLDTSITTKGPIDSLFNDNSSTATQVPNIEKPDAGSAGDQMEGYQPTTSGVVGAKQTQDSPSLSRSPVEGYQHSTPNPIHSTPNLINSQAGMFAKPPHEETSPWPQETTQHAINSQQTTSLQAPGTITLDRNDLDTTPQVQASNYAGYGSEAYHGISERKAEFDTSLNVAGSGHDSLRKGVPSPTNIDDTPVGPTASFNDPMAQDRGDRNLQPGPPGTQPTLAPAVPSWQQQPADSSASQQENRGVFSNDLASGSHLDPNIKMERRGDPNISATSRNWSPQQTTATSFDYTNSSMQNQYYSTGQERSHQTMTSRGPQNEERGASGSHQSWKAAAVVGGVAGAAGIGLGLAGGAAASAFMGSSGGPEPQTGLNQSPQYGDHQKQWSGSDHGDQNSAASFDNNVEGPSRSLSPTHSESGNEDDRMYDRGLPHGEHLDDNSYEREQSADVNADDDDGSEWNEEDEVQHNHYKMQRSADANADDGDEWFDEDQAQHNSYERGGFADVNAEDGSEWSDEDEAQRRVSSGFDEEFGNGDNDEDSNEASQGEQQFHNGEFDEYDGSETGAQNFQDEYEDSDQQDRESAQAHDPDDDGSQADDADFEPDMAENSSQNGEGDSQFEEHESDGEINRDIDEDEDEDSHSELYDDEQEQEGEHSSDDSHAFGADSDFDQDENEEAHDYESGSNSDSEEAEQDLSSNEDEVSEDQQDEYGSSVAEQNEYSDADEDVEAEESFQEEDSEEQGLDEEDSEEQELDDEDNDEDDNDGEESEGQDAYDEESEEQENYDEDDEEYAGSEYDVSDNAGLEYADSESEAGQAWQVQEQYGDDGVGDQDDQGGYSDDDGGDDYYE